MFKFGKKKDAKAAAETPAEEPAAAAGGEDGAAAPAKKKLPLKTMIIAGAAAVLVLGGGGGAAFFLMAPKGGDAKAGEHGKKKPKKGKGHAAKEGPVDKTQPQITDGPDGVVFYTLPDLVVNMQTADGKPTFLKLKLTLELPDYDTAEALGPERPRLQDMFTTFLRELRPEDLSGSQGTYQLRLEILRRINLVIAPAKVNAVLIEEMLIN